MKHWFQIRNLNLTFLLSNMKKSLDLFLKVKIRLESFSKLH